MRSTNAYEAVSAEARAEAHSVALSILNAVKEGEARDEVELDNLIHQKVDHALIYPRDQWLFAWGLPDSDNFKKISIMADSWDKLLAAKAYCNLYEFVTRGWAHDFEAAMKARVMTALRAALIVASTVEVLCPYCGEPQPNPDDGGDTWLPSEITEGQGPRECVSCDARFHIWPQVKVPVNQ